MRLGGAGTAIVAVPRNGGPTRVAAAIEAGIRGDLGSRVRYAATAFRASYTNAVSASRKACRTLWSVR